MGLKKRSHLWVRRSCLHRERDTASHRHTADIKGERPRLFSKTAEFLLPVEEPSPEAQVRQTEGSNAVVWTSLRGGGRSAVSTRHGEQTLPSPQCAERAGLGIP